MRILNAGLVSLSLVLACGAHATTWYVEKDGSGDFTTIQPAIDGSAPGDTIRIGAGRYTEYALYTPSPAKWTANVYVAVNVDSLTLIGEGSDLTVIGPETYHNEPPYGPKGIVTTFQRQLQVVDLAVENVRTGIYIGEGRYEMDGCRIAGCATGFVGWLDEGLIFDCAFLGCINYGIDVADNSSNVVIRDCTITDCDGGIMFTNGTTNSTAERCDVNGGTVGIQCSDGVLGTTIRDCVVDGASNVGITVWSGSQVHVEGCLVGGSQVQLKLTSNCHVTGSGNVLMGGTYATIRNSQSTMDFHGNHIMFGGRYSVQLEDFLWYLYDPDEMIDLTGNYWGTDEADSIEAWIWDVNDDPDNHAYVQYEPFSDVPLPTKKQTQGGLRRMFR